MGVHGELRMLSHAALLKLEEVADQAVEHLLVLTVPEGGLELKETPRGEAVIWGYSTVENLVEACGGGQPYARTTVADLALVTRDLGHVLIALDVLHPEGVRYAELDPSEMEPLEPVDWEVPDAMLLWIPTRPVRSGDRKVEVELHCTNPRVPLLLAYESIESLHAACGPFQAAAAVPVDRIDEVALEAGAHGVAFNPVLSEEARHTAPVVDWTRGDHFGL